MEKTKKAFWFTGCGTPRDRHNQYRVIGWSFAWVASWLLVQFSITSELLGSPVLAGAATLLPAVLGAGMILAYHRYLSQADELLRKIEVDALTLALGVGLVGGVSYRLLEMASVIPDGDIFTVMVLLVSGTYMIATILGHRRYA